MSEYELDYSGGSMRWHKNGALHRDDGPAIEWIDGLRHRLDGPAVVYADGGKEWWLDNKEYTKEEFVLYQFSRGIIINE